MDMPRTELMLSTSGELRMLVGQIRGYLSSSDQTGDDAIRELWQRYVEACLQINQRLDLCAQFLERGEWIEALRSAELEPDLFDCLAALEFPKRPLWEQLGCDLGWERLVPVQTTISERLQAAWDHRKRLRPLLKEHQRLAIARAPLAQRLAVMHELAKQDKMSTFWRDDIQRFEKSRGPQLIRELRQAVAAEETKQLITLVAEVRETPWTLKLPSSLRRLEQQAELILLEQILLPETAKKLNDARLECQTSVGCLLLMDWDDRLGRLRTLQPVDSHLVKTLLASTAAAVKWAKHGAESESLVASWETAARQLMQAASIEATSMKTLKRLWEESQEVFKQIPDSERDESLAHAAAAAFQSARKQRILARCVTAAMILTAVFVPGFLITLFMMWVFS